MLFPPTPSFLQKTLPFKLGSRNNSTTSFCSSNADEITSSHNAILGQRQSESTKSHQSSFELDRQSRQSIENIHDTGNPTIEKRRNHYSLRKRSKSTNRAPNDTSSSANGSLKGLGKRLFSRSSTNLSSPSTPSSSRSHSTLSSSAHNSPPLTPTTPPVLPIRLPNGKKDFFANLPNLPPMSVNSTGALFASLGDTLDEYVSTATKYNVPLFDHAAPLIQDPPKHSFATNEMHLLPLSPMPRSSSLTSLAELSSTPSSTSSATVRHDLSPETDPRDSDFLRAVLNYGETDFGFSSPSKHLQPSPSNKHSNPARSFSSPPASSITPPIMVRRLQDGRMLLSEAAAKELSTSPSHKPGDLPRVYLRPGLFRREDEDSEDEYGDDDSPALLPPVKIKSDSNPNAIGLVNTALDKAIPHFPSPLAKINNRLPSFTHAQDIQQPPLPLSPLGLETPSKRALYTCTLLKIHSHLAATLASDPEAKKIPAIANENFHLKNNELNFPRSTNSQLQLHQHSSTFAVTRDLRVALSRTEMLRKLKRSRITLEQDVEISWFQRKYGTGTVPPEQIAKAIMQGKVVSPEALARPLVTASMAQETSPLSSLASSRRLSGIVNLAPGQQLSPSSSEHERNGIVAWARRPSFPDRTTVTRAENHVAPGDIVVSYAVEIVGTAPASVAQKKKTCRPQPISYSNRIRMLANLPSAEEEQKKMTPKPLKFRRRETLTMKAQNMFSSAEPSWSSQLSIGRPSPQQAAKRQSTRALPPWIAPRSSQLLSPDSAKALLRSSSMTSLLPAPVPLESRAGESNRRWNNQSAPVGETVIEEMEELTDDGQDSSDEEVPLAKLRELRAKQSEIERIRKLEEELDYLKLRELGRERQEKERKQKQDETKILEKNRKLLMEARARRNKTRQSTILASANYGAGNPLLDLSKRSSPKQDTHSTSLEAKKSSRAIQRVPSLAQLSINSVSGRISPHPPTSPTRYHGVPEQSHSPVSATLPRSYSLQNISAYSGMHPAVAAPVTAVAHPYSFARDAPISPPMAVQRRGDHHYVSHVPQPYGMGMRSSMSATNLHSQAYMHPPNAHVYDQTMRTAVRSRAVPPPLISLPAHMVPSSTRRGGAWQ